MPKNVNRERGLNYIIEKMEKDGTVSSRDINLFLTDLELPVMTKDVIETKFLEVGGSSKRLTKLIDFFAFISDLVIDSDETTSVNAFKIFDKHESGFINSEELRHAMSCLGDTLKHEEIDQIIKTSDLDGDGTINYEEVVKVLGSMEEEFWSAYKK